MFCVEHGKSKRPKKHREAGLHFGRANLVSCHATKSWRTSHLNKTRDASDNEAVELDCSEFLLMEGKWFPLLSALSEAYLRDQIERRMLLRQAAASNNPNQSD